MCWWQKQCDRTNDSNNNNNKTINSSNNNKSETTTVSTNQKQYKQQQKQQQQQQQQQPTTTIHTSSSLTTTANQKQQKNSIINNIFFNFNNKQNQKQQHQQVSFTHPEQEAWLVSWASFRRRRDMKPGVNSINIRKTILRPISSFFVSFFYGTRQNCFTFYKNTDGMAVKHIYDCLWYWRIAVNIMNFRVSVLFITVVKISKIRPKWRKNDFTSVFVRWQPGIRTGQHQTVSNPGKKPNKKSLIWRQFYK